MRLVRHCLLPTAAAAALGCAEPVSSIDPDGPPHVVLVLVDTLRADHTSLHGYERDTTPNLERLAAEGAWMKRHFANAPWTKPSVASIMTGLHPSAHGSRIGQFEQQERGLGQIEVLHEDNETFVEVLDAVGYDTAAHVSNIHMQPKWGYSQGFDDYRFVERASHGNVVDSDCRAVEYAIDTLDAADTPTFVWVHLMAVHEYVAPRRHRVYSVDRKTPIDPNAPGAARVTSHGSIEMATAHYDQAIRYADDLVGELYDEMMEKHPNSVLIVTSDHGEEFYDHGGFEHCRTLYNELLRVPLVIAGNGVAPGTEIEGITDSIDLYPTILRLVGIDVEGLSREGRPLFDARGAASGGKPETFAEQHHRGNFIRFALNRSGRKLIESYSKRSKREGAERLGALRDREWYEEAWGPETAEMRAMPSESDRRDMLDRIERFRERTRAWFEESVGEIQYGTVTRRDLDELKQLGYGNR